MLESGGKSKVGLLIKTKRVLKTWTRGVVGGAVRRWKFRVRADPGAKARYVMELTAGMLRPGHLYTFCMYNSRFKLDR